MTSSPNPNAARRRSTPAFRARVHLAGAGLVGLGAVICAWTTGGGDLGAPPLRGPGGLDVSRWASDRSPLAIAMGTVRLGVLLGGLWLLAIVTVAVASGVFAATRHGTTRRTCDVVLPGWAGRWRDVAFALTLTSTSATLLSATGASAAQRAPLPGTQRTTIAAEPRVGDPGSGQRWPDFDAREAPTTTSTTAPQRATATPPSSTQPTQPTTTQPTQPTTTQPMATKPATFRNATVPTPVPRAAAEPPESISAPSTVVNTTEQPRSALAPDTHTVRRGDSLWSIAESVVIRARPEAGEADVAAYWVGLVAANRSGLRDPDNVDYLLPGDTVTLPAIAATDRPAPPET